MNRIDQFLEELKEISLKYGLTIGGNDYYAGPCLDDIKSQEEQANLLTWDYKLEKYTVIKKVNISQ